MSTQLRGRKIAGFTLLELLTVLTIISIIAMIAYPSYIDQIRKSRRAVAKSALLNIANQEEQFFFSHRNYTEDLTAFGYSSSAVYLNNENSEVSASDAIYVLRAKTTGCGTSPCFGLTADAQNDQAKDAACATYSLTSSNEKLPDPAVSNCW